MSDSSSDDNSSCDVEAFSDHDSDELSCSSHSFEEASQAADEAQEIHVLPYQFEPEYTQEELTSQLEASGHDRDLEPEDRQQNTDW